MIIHDNRKERTTNFGAIKCGETFYDPYENIHAMKISYCIDGNDERNAVALSNGFLRFYEYEAQVIFTKTRVEVYE